MAAPPGVSLLLRTLEKHLMSPLSSLRKRKVIKKEVSFSSRISTTSKVTTNKLSHRVAPF